MIGAFTYLFWRSLHNRLAGRLRRLRNPRYLAALLFGLAYLWVVLVEQRPRSGGEPAHSPPRTWLELVTALAVAGAVAWGWVFGSERRVLAFTPAEVTFLFSAPVSRRWLIHYKLLRNQLLILFNTLLWTLLLSRERFGTSLWLRTLSIWVILTTLSLHRLGAAFVRTSLMEHGRFGLRHRLVSLGVLTAAILAAASITWSSIPELVPALHDGVGALLRAIVAAAGEPLAYYLLLPFRLLVRPLSAGTPSEWASAIWPAVGILLLHYVWVLRSDTAFEEAAAEASLERARLLSGRQAGATLPAPARPLPRFLHLRPTGWPAGAILWKNLVEVLRARRLRRVLLPIAVGGVFTAVVSVRGEEAIADIVGYLSLFWAGIVLVMGPQWIRNDLRTDLLKLEVLRSYPLRGAAVVASEVAASTAVLTIIQWALLLVAYLAFLGTQELATTLGERTLLLGAALISLPAVNFIGLLIHNGVVLFFPGWVQLGAGRAGGVEALGQNMLMVLAFLGVLGVLLVLPLILGGAAFLALRPLLGGWALLPATAPFIIGVGVESRILVLWLGRVFERTDPAEVAAGAW